MIVIGRSFTLSIIVVDCSTFASCKPNYLNELIQPYQPVRTLVQMIVIGRSFSRWITVVNCSTFASCKLYFCQDYALKMSQVLMF